MFCTSQLISNLNENVISDVTKILKKKKVFKTLTTMKTHTWSNSVLKATKGTT